MNSLDWIAGLVAYAYRKRKKKRDKKKKKKTRSIFSDTFLTVQKQSER